MPRLLILSRYSRLGASSRLRMMQFIPHLEEAGFEIDLRPFVNSSYIEKLYKGKSQRLSKAKYVLARLKMLLLAKSYDLIWIEKEALPWLPFAIEGLILPKKIPIVSDFDDAVFHQYDLHKNTVVRHLLGKKIDRAMANSSLVMAGNDYLAERARLAGAGNIAVVPTVVDVGQYSTIDFDKSKLVRNVGWIGSPGTWREYVVPRLPMLRTIVRQHHTKFNVVGAGDSMNSDEVVDFFPWSEDTEIHRIQQMAIGIMPLTDTPWARGKCGFKLIQYMACGLPVIASPVGVNRHIIEHGKNGFLASSDEEWENALNTLLQDPDLRHRMGREGRAKVENEFSRQVWGPRIAELLVQSVPVSR